jgi:hypothetical protein
MGAMECNDKVYLKCPDHHKIKHSYGRLVCRWPTCPCLSSPVPDLSTCIVEPQLLQLQHMEGAARCICPASPEPCGVSHDLLGGWT